MENLIARAYLEECYWEDNIKMDRRKVVDIVG
jgi:hypothetical protein